MPEPEDILEIRGVRLDRRTSGKLPAQTGGPRSKFLSVWFRCCHTYGRLNRNEDRTAYEGRCPRCGAAVRALIGPGGTSRRTFETG